MVVFWDDWACRGIGGQPSGKMAGQHFTQNFTPYRGVGGLVSEATEGLLRFSGVGVLEWSGGWSWGMKLFLWSPAGCKKKNLQPWQLRPRL